jgi:histidinol-phosphatase (PHP family)
MTLPPDSHVHTEWSWDSPDGSMERTCARAVEIGLPAVAFTEHADYTGWFASDMFEYEHLRQFATPDCVIPPPELAATGYLACLERCREKFPGLRIISGVELGEPHWHGEKVRTLLHAGQFDRVLGSVHNLANGEHFSEPHELFMHEDAAVVMRNYLAEAAKMISSCGTFGVLAHIDYPVRYWPDDATPFAPNAFEDEFRLVLRLLADSDRALEVNTRVPLHPEVVRWWRAEGGRAVTFGSDAHDPSWLANGFPDAVAMVEAIGFRPGRKPYDVWTL